MPEPSKQTGPASSLSNEDTDGFSPPPGSLEEPSASASDGRSVLGSDAHAAAGSGTGGRQGSPSRGGSRPSSSGAGSSGVGSSGAGSSRTGSSRTGSSKVGSSKAGDSAAGYDTQIGRLAVEQGLATLEEVEHAKGLARDAAGAESHAANERSLAQLLVECDYITQRQLKRLRAQLETERSSQNIPGYQIQGKLGAGAMATVFKAKQVSLDRAVAIKVLPKKYSSNPQFIERFFAEGKAAALLDHPNVVRAIEIGQAGDLYYFVMEYVEGRTVHDDIVSQKHYKEREAIEVAIQVAEALKHAHERGLIHRDVKPKNIMITKAGVVKLADMGLARAISDKEAAEAEAGKAFGTPYYISPEQIRGEREIGPQADIYSLGATLYHMVTGAVPFDGKDPPSVMRKHLKGSLTPPDQLNPSLSNGISEIIEMMMARSRRDRYKKCDDLLADLRAVQRGETPPIAHKELLLSHELAGLAEAEAGAAGEIREDSSRAAGPGLGEIAGSPLFVIVAVLLALSAVANIVQALV